MSEKTLTLSGSAGSADVDQRPVDGEQPQVGVEVDAGADRVEDQVEPAGKFLERRRVGGREVVVRAETQAVLLLLQRLREHGDLGAEGVGDPDGHVTEAAEADDGDLLAGSGAPAAQRGVGGDAGAQQWCRGGRVEAGGHGEDVVGVDDDVGGVAALGGGAVAVGAGVRGDHAVGAVLLVAVAAVGALAARVDHAADADAVADLVRGDVGAGFGDDADDLVAGYDGEGLGSPVAVDGVDVGVADAGVLDRDEDVVGSDLATLDGGGGQRLAGGGCCVGVDAHVELILRLGCRAGLGGRAWSTCGPSGSASGRGGASPSWLA